MQIINVRDVAREARTIRNRYMLRQSEVARAVGVSRQWFSALENGKASLDLGLVLRAFDERASTSSPPGASGRRHGARRRCSSVSLHMIRSSAR